MPNSTLSPKDRKQAVFDGLYNTYQVGVEYRDQSVDQLADRISQRPNQIKDDVGELVEIGILSRRLEYGTATNTLGPGRHYHWTVLVPKEEGADRLEKLLQERDTFLAGKGHRAAQTRRANLRQARTEVPLMKETVVEETEPVALSEVEETRAIAGPDAPTIGRAFPQLRALRRDEAGALVEAARRYQNRSSVMLQKLDELEALAKTIGVIFSKERALESIAFDDPDPRLEAIALILPHIDSLIAKRDSLIEQTVTMADKVRRFNELDAENARLRRRNDELTKARVAERVQVAASAH